MPIDFNSDFYLERYKEANGNSSGGKGKGGSGSGGVGGADPTVSRTVNAFQDGGSVTGGESGSSASGGGESPAPEQARSAIGNEYFIKEGAEQGQPSGQRAAVQDQPSGSAGRAAGQGQPVSGSRMAAGQGQPSGGSESDRVVLQKSNMDSLIESSDQLANNILNYSKKALSVLGRFALRSLKKGFTAVDDFKETQKFKKSKHMVRTKLYDCNVLTETGEAQILNYRGKKREIVMPSMVKTKSGSFVITSMAPKCLSFQSFRSVVSNATDSRILDTDVDDFKDFTGGIQSLRLPGGLLSIPSKAFAFAGKIDCLHVPKSVQRVSISAFSWSSIHYVKFYGPCPVGLRDAKLPSGCIVLYRKEFEDQFAFLGIQGKAQKG